MYLLLSGEGPGDIGACDGGGEPCEGGGFRPGPMALFVDRIVQAKHDYSPREASCWGFVSESALARRALELKEAKEMRLPGKKRGRETRYFFNNARVLARIATEIGRTKGDDIVAVLFRDADGTASAGRGLWGEKYKSMLDGFAEEGFLRGVAMIPKPKSEAWLLCALGPTPYQACEALEERSGNDDSPDSLKGELRDILGEGSSVTGTLLARIEDGSIDPLRIEMPSYVAFRERLEQVA
jgi:hypothetical protein